VTSEEWRKNPELVRWAGGLFQTQEFRELLTILRTETPEYNMPVLGVMDPTSVAVRYGQSVQHQRTIAAILALGVPPPPPPVELAPTFEPPQEDK
jgi:hypothetical protein